LTGAVALSVLGGSGGFVGLVGCGFAGSDGLLGGSWGFMGLVGSVFVGSGGSVGFVGNVVGG
jgi:hypothetical protein